MAVLLATGGRGMRRRRQPDDGARRSRQWGADRRIGGLPVLAAVPGRTTISAARFLVFFTVVAWAGYVIDQSIRMLRVGVTAAVALETAMYMLLVSLLTASAIAYLVARLGSLYRARDHRRVPRSSIDDGFDFAQPSVTVIVPSYREEPRVIRQTLLSAALQEYPGLRVVLLIDDPAMPDTDHHRMLLDSARALPAEIEALLAEPRDFFRERLAEFDHAHGLQHEVGSSALEALATHYETAAEWFSTQGSEIASAPNADHSDAFLALEVFERMANDMSATAVALREASRDSGAHLSRRRAHQLYRRLVWIFSAEVTSFERKQFASLSHEANKAMNLNSYLDLMGCSFVIETFPGGRVLVDALDREPDLRVPDSDYVLTLDADSTLLPEYCLRLVSFMEEPENADVAVVQTPYSSYRGASTRIERIAGATTDVQHIVHQGLTHYDATFWVGANAVLRKAAIEQLRVRSTERGFEISRFIADRTVVEDTESSIDLRAVGWRLHNHAERLSYSATPPDFGSLVVERKRWANGGLVILPNLLRLVRKRPGGRRRPALLELFLRTNYLASIAWVSLGLLLLLLYPFDQRLLSWFAVATAAPYFVATASDLRRCGYKRRDVARLYGFNLLLLPVNLAGAASSLVQMIGGQKVDFARTPKVKGRTVAPLAFVLMPVVLFLWSAYTFARYASEGNYPPAVFAGLNVVLLAYAFVSFVGVRAAVVDVFVGLRERIYVPVSPTTDTEPVPHWASVLFIGTSVPEDLPRSAPLAGALAARDQLVAAGTDPAVFGPTVTVPAASPPGEPPLWDDGAVETVDVREANWIPR